MPVKGRDDGNNLHDVYTTNESLSILQQAIDSGSMQGIDPSLNPVVEAIKESHADNNLTFWQGTEAEFNELGISGEILGAKIDSNGKIYVLTGDTTLSDAVANAAAAAEQVLGNKADISTVNSLQSDYYTFKNAANGVVLYENSSSGSVGTITLNDGISNYDRIDIVVYNYNSSTYVGTYTVYIPRNSFYILIRDCYVYSDIKTSTGQRWYNIIDTMFKYLVSGNTITSPDIFNLRYNDYNTPGGTPNITIDGYGNTNYIRKVIGYKKIQ